MPNEDDSAEAIPSKAEENVSTLVKVSEEILGEWARPADYEAPKNAYMPSTYFDSGNTGSKKP